MFLISSFRPNAKGAIADNQQRALASWLNAFEAIRYFNAPQADMMAPRVAFTNLHTDPPTIKRMMECASRAPDWCAIANADIIVAKKFKAVEEQLRAVGAKCATSRRFTYSPDSMREPARALPEDLGLDIFCAVPEVWRQAAAAIPEQYVIGKQRWDTWTLAFFMKHWPNECFEFSRSGVIFHPIHGDRIDQGMPEFDAALVSTMTWPTQQIAI